MVSSASESSRRRPPRVRRIWRKRVVRWTVIGAIVVVLLVLTVTQTPMLGWIVMGQIEGRLGGTASAGSCRVSMDGELVVRDLSLRLNGLEGEAAEYLRADQLRAQIDWGRLLSGQSPITAMELNDATVRVSLDEDTSEVNVSRLRPRTGSGMSGGYPRIELRGATIELGEHRPTGPGTAASYTRLTTLNLEGQMVERADAPRRYSIELAEMPSAVDGAGARLVGSIDQSSGEVVLTLTGLDLAEWSSRTAPTRIREFWQALDVRGAIDDATFTYGPAEGLAVRLTPRDVDLLIPMTVADDGAPGGSRREMLQMRDVRGSIVFAQSGFTADLAGAIEELACRVTMQYDSYSFDSSYRAQIETDRFTFADEGGLNRFAPPLMVRVMDRFLEPQAELAGFVRVSRGRGSDGSPGRTVTEGILNISNGSGRFAEYPYPIENIEGRVQFDEREVRLVDITGESATGARLLATGRIWPPRDGAAVEIDVRIEDLKTDALFAQSLPENRRSVYETIFSREEYERLRESGAVLSIADRNGLLSERIEVQASLDRLAGDASASAVEVERLRVRLASIDAALETPVFELGGTGTLDIAIRREEGDDSRYEETIVIDIPEAGLVVDRFPYPATAERLRLTIEDGTATIATSVLRGLRGGAGTISGGVRYTSDDYAPDIRISAGEVPIDGLLIQALPGRERFEERASGDGGDSEFSVHRFLRRLNLVGTAGCEAHIFASERGSTDFRVEVAFDGVAAHPPGAIGVSDEDLMRFKAGDPGIAPALLTDLSSAFVVTDDFLDMPSLAGRVGEDQGAFSGSVRVEYPAREGDPRRVTRLIDVDLEGRSIAVGQPLERVLDAADASRAGVVVSLREQFDPAGRLDARLTLDGSEEDLRYAVEADRIERLVFNAFGGRAEVVGATGTVGITPGRVALDSVEGVLRFNDALAGRLRVDGGYSLEALGAGGGTTESLAGSVRDALFESQLPEAVVGRFSPALGERVASLELAGLFDTDFTLRSGDEPSLDAEVRPRTLALSRDGHEAVFDRVEGSIGVSDSGGAIDLELSSTDLNATVDGAWSRTDAEPFGLATTISATAASLHDGVRAMLPDAVVSMMNGMEMASDSTLSMSDANLRIDGGGAFFEGVVGFEAMDVRIGLRLEDLVGRASIEARLTDGRAPEVAVDLSGERAVVGGAQLSDVRARVETGARFISAENGREADAPGTVYVPSVSASIAGGRLAASGEVRPDAQSASFVGGAWRAQADLSGLDFGRLLAEVSRDPAGIASAPENRGLLDANLSLTGRLGNVNAQRGRALIRVQPAPGSDGTEVLRLPGLIQFVKLSSLQAPVSEPIDFAYAEAFIEGPVVSLHDLSAESKSVSIKGSGTMTLPDLGLDLTFTTVVLRDVSLLTEIFERVRNELVTARVGGTLYDPRVEVEQLTATRRLLDAIIGGEDDSPRP
ncbi:MAG: hypothetical protein ABL309_10950 [Phycisphaerales bacterium]